MKKLLGLFFTIALAFVLFACETTTPGGTTAEDTDVLVVGYDPFSEKFSPFFSATAYDADVVSMTSVGLMTTDRDGGIVYNAIDGETIARGANEYFYSGLSDITVVHNTTTDKTTYTIKIRDDVQFSDGHVLDADDIIFTYYVLLDPNYSGSSTLYSADIVGYTNYKLNSTKGAEAQAIADEIVALVGETGSNATLDAYVLEQISGLLTDEFGWVASIIAANQYKSYWKKVDGTKWAEGDTASVAATFVGFYGDLSTYSVVGKTDAQVIADVAATYGHDYAALDAAYGATVIAPLVANKALEIGGTLAGAGDPVATITGINKVSQTEVTVETNGFDAAAIYQICGITVAPMHYYGDATLYNYAEHEFGFNARTADAMDLIETKTANPMGAGPYKFVKFENNVVFFESNPLYFKGAPEIEYINFQVVAEANKISSIAYGDIDVANPSGSKTKFAEIATYGEALFTSSIDNLGYGYVGINALNVQVGTTAGTAGSTASKALRSAFATVISALRYTAINSYYGSAASVINYPISNTSWAAPKAADAGYEVAFAKNPDGTNAYTVADPSTLAESVRLAAAKAAAKLWLEAAGYTLVAKAGTATYGGSLWTATAPAGAKITYEVIIPGDGTGDHPSFAIVTGFKAVLAELGITININDPSDSNVLWDALDNLDQEMWCAAWGQTIDPDMYQVYHSDNVVGDLAAPNSTGSNHYYLRDTNLDAKILAARTSADQTFRKATYKEAMDIVLDWAVEVPIYQRQNIVSFSAERVNVSTLTPEITTYWGWMAEIEKLDMN